MQLLHPEMAKKSLFLTEHGPGLKKGQAITRHNAKFLFLSTNSAVTVP